MLPTAAIPIGIRPARDGLRLLVRTARAARPASEMPVRRSVAACGQRMSFLNWPGVTPTFARNMRVMCA